MNTLVLLAVLQTGDAVPASDTAYGQACSDADQVAAIVERHSASLPHGSKVSMRVIPEGTMGAARVEVWVMMQGETPVVERQSVNSCDEAFAFLDFYLSVWAPPESELRLRSSLSHDQSSDTESSDSEQSPPTVLFGGYTQGTSNHPDRMGFGAGLGLDMALDSARLGAFGTWYQPILLEGVDKASYHLHRFDLGGHLCAKAATSPLAIWPCLGVSVRQYSIPENEAARGADTKMAMASIDASLVAARTLTASFAIEAALTFRHAMLDLELNEFRVGNYTPSMFEVGFKLGLTWDIPKLFFGQPSTSSTETAASREELQPW